jgi:hypothetical protein
MHRAGNPPSQGAATLKVGRKPHYILRAITGWSAERGGVKSVGHTPKSYDTFEAARQATYKPHRVREESAEESAADVGRGSRRPGPQLHKPSVRVRGMTVALTGSARRISG